MTKVRRIKTTRWKDPRLAGGILLIAVSAVAGGYLFQGPPTVPVYQAEDTVLPGTSIATAGLQTVEMPADVAEAYLGPHDDVGQAQLTQVVTEGQLVARSFIEHEKAEGNVLVVPLLSPAPASLGKGSHAQLWRVRQAEPGGKQARAELVAGDVLIVSVGASEAMMLDQITAEIRVQDYQIAAVLAVLGSQDGLVLVEGEAP